MAQEDSVLVAKQSFFCEVNGIMTRIPVHTTVRVGHPILKGREQYFAPLVIDYDLKSPPARRARMEGGGS